MLENLSPREREIFDLLLEGDTAKEITYKLHISIHTVDFHRTNLYDKLGVNSIQELFIKYGKNVPSEPGDAPKGVIIPAHELGFLDLSDKSDGGNSTTDVFVSREEINGTVIDGVLNIDANLVKSGIKSEFAQAYTYKEDIIQRLRQANGIRFKALGDGKSWFVEFKTIESTPERNHANFMYEFGTVRDQIIVVEISYSSLYLPEWHKQYSFDFNKETIKGLDIVKGPLCQYGLSLLQIFDFEFF